MRGATVSTQKTCLRNIRLFSATPPPARRYSILTTHVLRAPATSPTLSQERQYLPRIITSNMASYSNTDTGSKPADPYKEKNLQEPELKAKVEDLVKFMEHCKFGMMTTRIASTGLLTSRCMALAAKVGISQSSSSFGPVPNHHVMLILIFHRRRVVELTFCFTPTQSRARPMTFSLTPRSTSLS